MWRNVPMARPLRIEFEGALYHVTSRGDEKREIFKTPTDRQRFLEYLSSATERYGAVIHCYCLMTNHYHIFVETPRGNLSQIMRHINGAYTTYYNVKRKHAGHLFQGRYKAIVVEADQYALELSRYVHLNPVRAGIAPTPEDYQWSSYSSYIGEEQPPLWLHRKLVLAMIAEDLASSQQRYRVFVEDLIGKEYDSPLLHAVASTILGSAEFVEAVMADFVEKEAAIRDVPALRALNRRYHVENIMAKAQEVVDDPVLARDVAMHLCHRYSGERLKEIGIHFEIGDSGVAKASARLAKRLEVDELLRDKVKEILRCLGHVKVQT
jgi:REP element-mobilizing transposase RayT